MNVQVVNAFIVSHWIFRWRIAMNNYFMPGLELIRRIRADHPGLPVMPVTKLRRTSRSKVTRCMEKSCFSGLIVKKFLILRMKLWR